MQGGTVKLGCRAMLVVDAGGDEPVAEPVPADRATGSAIPDEPDPFVDFASAVDAEQERRCDGGMAVLGDQAFDSIRDAVAASVDGDVIPGIWWGQPASRASGDGSRVDDLVWQRPRPRDSGDEQHARARGVSVRDGRVTEAGGGIRAHRTHLELRCMSLQNNRAQDVGSAVFVEGGSSTVRSSWFGDNVSERGAIIGVRTDRFEPSPVAVTPIDTHLSSTLLGSCPSALGVHADAPATVRLQRGSLTGFAPTFLANGVLSIEVWDRLDRVIDGTVLATNVSEDRTSAVDVFGDGPTTVDIRDATFEQNVAGGFHSVVSLRSGADLTVTIDDAVFVGNRSGQAAMLETAATGLLDLKDRDSIFERNASDRIAVLEVRAKTIAGELSEVTVHADTSTHTDGAALGVPETVALSCVDCDLGFEETDNAPTTSNGGSSTSIGARARRSNAPEQRVDRCDSRDVEVTGMENQNAGQPSDPDLIRRLLRARDRMTAAPAEDWPVQRLARVSGVSAAHFARSFKATFGVPPHRYLLTLRLERALALLRDTQLPISDVALVCGWTSIGTFGRTFRDVVGASPSTVRRRPRRHGDQAIPVCVLKAADRPCLTIAVSEKRRQERDG